MFIECLGAKWGEILMAILSAGAETLALWVDMNNLS